jgi:hypothetical protein
LKIPVDIWAKMKGEAWQGGYFGAMLFSGSVGDWRYRRSLP